MVDVVFEGNDRIEAIVSAGELEDDERIALGFTSRSRFFRSAEEHSGNVRKAEESSSAEEAAPRDR